MKLLIVDDDQDDMDLLRAAIHDVAAVSDCRLAPTGPVATSVLEVFAPDVVFLDAIKYPVTSKEMLGTFALQQRFRYTRFVVMSRALPLDEQKQFMSMGARSVCEKPEDYTMLCQKLKLILAPNAVTTRVKIFTNDTVVHEQTNTIQTLLDRYMNFDIELNTRKPSPNIQFMASEVELGKIQCELGYNMLFLQGGHWLPKI